MMHLTCTNMPEASIREAIIQAKEGGLQNLLALRGGEFEVFFFFFFCGDHTIAIASLCFFSNLEQTDPPRGEEWKQIEGGFAYASDLIKYIRNNWGDQWSICVAGYPEVPTLL